MYRGVRSTQVRERDAHLVGEYVECLRAFGSDDSDPLIQLEMTFLLRAQDPNTHRWDVGGDASSDGGELRWIDACVSANTSI